MEFKKHTYSRSLDIKSEYDVCVVGGGPAGFCAAVQSARMGAKTALIEKYSSLGGAITTGGNPQIALFYAHGKQIISGIGWETVKRLSDMGWAKIPDFEGTDDHSVLGVNVNGPMMAKLMDDLCIESNVDLYLLQPVCDVIKSEMNSGRLDGVVISSKTGLEVIKSKIFIDCSGDGDLSFLAGAKYEIGENNSTELQPGTLRFYLTGFNINDIDKNQVEEAFSKALMSGEVVRDDYWPKGGSAYYIFTNNGNNINHIANLNSADSKSRMKAEIEGRNSVARIVSWARKHVKGAEKIEAVACAFEVCARESRRIVCDTKITAKDYVSAVAYEDSICYSFYPIDLHRAGHESLENIFLEEDKVPSIPYFAMTVKGFDNLLVAGRCIWGDRLANSAFRVKASCMAMGQAAGAAAAIAAKKEIGIRDVPIEELKTTLRKNGAIVPGYK